MDIIKYYHHRGSIDEISNHYRAFSIIKNAKIRDASHLKWKDVDTGKISHHLQVAFFGKTGYGKSTTVNAFFGKKTLKTSDVSACTRNCDSLDFELSPDCYLSLADFPGIGENEYRDKEYLSMYNSFLSHSTAVIYILRADTRDYAIDELAYNSVFATDNDKKKVIFAVNFCDKIEPISRNYLLEPNLEQLHNINKKIDTLSKIFNPVNEIIPYSAETNWNINKLSGELIKLILNSGEIENDFYLKIIHQSALRTYIS